jgi:hypothetical protein
MNAECFPRAPKKQVEFAATRAENLLERGAKSRFTVRNGEVAEWLKALVC